MPLIEEKNYFITSNAVWTNKNNEWRTWKKCGYVKMSELENVCKLTKNDINPSASGDESELFFKYLNALVKEDKKEEIGYYLIEYIRWRFYTNNNTCFDDWYD